MDVGTVTSEWGNIAIPASTEDVRRICTELKVTFPSLGALAECRVLGVGFRSIVIETGDRLVFKIARNEMAALGHSKEAHLLPALVGHVCVPVPKPLYYSGPSSNFPFGVLGYTKLPGIPLDWRACSHMGLERIARRVADFLLALHAFPMEEALSLGLPGAEEQRADVERMADRVLPVLHSVLTAEEYRRVNRWWQLFLSDERMQNYKPSLHHGDLWYENILVETSDCQVMGILDFENAAVGDPAQDFATQLHVGRPFADRVIAAYRAGGGFLDQGFEYRIQRLWELREFEGLHFAVSVADQIEVEDAIRKLRSGPILNP